MHSTFKSMTIYNYQSNMMGISHICFCILITSLFQNILDDYHQSHCHAPNKNQIYILYLSMYDFAAIRYACEWKCPVKTHSHFNKCVIWFKSLLLMNEIRPSCFQTSAWTSTPPPPKYLRALDVRFCKVTPGACCKPGSFLFRYPTRFLF